MFFVFCMTWGPKKTFLMFIAHCLTYSLSYNPMAAILHIYYKNNDVILNTQQSKAFIIYCD